MLLRFLPFLSIFAVGILYFALGYLNGDSNLRTISSLWFGLAAVALLTRITVKRPE